MHLFQDGEIDAPLYSLLGRRLAELELYVLMVKMLTKYRLTTDITEMKKTLQTVLKPDIPVNIIFKNRL